MIHNHDRQPEMLDIHNQLFQKHGISLIEPHGRQISLTQKNSTITRSLAVALDRDAR